MLSTAVPAQNCTQTSCRILQATGLIPLSYRYTEQQCDSNIHVCGQHYCTDGNLHAGILPDGTARTRDSRDDVEQPQTKGGAITHKLERTKTPVIPHGIELAWRESSSHRSCRTRGARPLLSVWRRGRVDVLGFVPLLLAQPPPR